MQNTCSPLHGRRDYFIEAPSKKDLHKWVKKIEISLGLRKEGIGLSDFELMSVVGKGAAGMVYAVSLLAYVCMYVCVMHVCVYAVYMYMYVYYICMYLCIYVYICVCVNTSRSAYV